MSSSVVTRLIEEVRKRPQLWNQNHYLHHTRPLIGDNWEEIANILGTPSKLFTNSRLLSMSNASLNPANLVKTKWKGLRDNFRKEVKKCIRMGDSYVPWVHFRACSFLWSVLDTSHLEATPEQIEELKKKYGDDQEVDLEAFDQTNNLENMNDDDDSMDFHDYIFADEVPVGELLKQEQAKQLQVGYDPSILEEGEIVTGGNDDEEDLKIIEPIIEQVDIPDDEEDLEQNQNIKTSCLPMPTLKITEPRTLKKPLLKKFVPLRIIKKGPVVLPELTPLSKCDTDADKKTCVDDSLPKLDDSDLHFLKSVLPYLKQVKSKRKSYIKEMIRQVIVEEISKNNTKNSKKLDVNHTTQIVMDINNGRIIKEEDEIIL